MSLNAQNNPTRRQHLLNNAAMADYGLDKGNLKLIHNEATGDDRYARRRVKHGWYECKLTGESYNGLDAATLDWGHLSQLVQEAINMSGFLNLPHNLTNMVSAGVAPNAYPRYVSEAGAQQVVERVQRFCGWLKAAAKLPGVSRLIKATQSCKGMCSPRTTIDLWSLAARYTSPGRLERKLWSVRERATELLHEEGVEQTASWRAVSNAVMQNAKRGKAAKIALALQLSGAREFTYRQARAWLQEYRACSVADQSDGVNAILNPHPVLTRDGVSVHRIALPILTRRGYQVGINLEYLVRAADGSTYHSNWGGAEEAFFQAQRAWRQRATASVSYDQLVRFLTGEEGVCPFFTRQDSYAAGNCATGTEAWLRRLGWHELSAVPGGWLVKHLDYSLVRNVVAHKHAGRVQQLQTA